MAAPHMHHLDLLLAALLYGCLFAGALLAATAAGLLALLAAALLAALALAASDVRALVAGNAAREAAARAAADLRLARALTVYCVLRAAVRAALALRPKAAAAASLVKGLAMATRRRGHGLLSFVWRAEHFSVAA